MNKFFSISYTPHDIFIEIMSPTPRNNLENKLWPSPEAEFSLSTDENSIVLTFLMYPPSRCLGDAIESATLIGLAFWHFLEGEACPTNEDSMGVGLL
mmetsp:Transcript_36031/g.48731  ORF Transcript_36031/g.48731 Transcript_36031/m.48731 type:complete len:97 (-) Transcript_36031:37-327(-)